tara:strand:- start:235 stop:609 length:375 start_codon:yes stop_codon:yes gene_type:complete
MDSYNYQQQESYNYPQQENYNSSQYETNLDIFKIILNTACIFILCSYFKFIFIKYYKYFKMRRLLKGQYFKNDSLIKECVICLEDINTDEKIIKLPCKHYYHKFCLLSWIDVSKTCPTCRMDIP